jgi:predicted acylesterase/phospholipase RssA
MEQSMDRYDEEPVFEIGLVMAGAVSAGAYTAGVVDFLLEALDEWQRLRESGDKLCPPHRVKIRAMSGASAGAMTAGVTAAAFGGEIQHVTPHIPEYDVKNTLYDSWVRQIDISHLLNTKDISESTSRIRSLFDSTIIDTIADNAFKVIPGQTMRDYISDPLEIFLSIANLRGVPYNIGFKGETEAGHELSLRSDYLHFYIGSADSHPEHAARLELSDYDSDAWSLLKQGALASGAFPIGLTPRVITRKISDYSGRKWPIPLDTGDIKGRKGQDCTEWRAIAPGWPADAEHDDSFSYTFLSVDGGLLDNEPLELARRALAGANDRNEREGSRARKAILLIDPFPFDEPFKLEYEVKDEVFNIIPQLFSSLRSQSRFKPDELVLAQRENVFSRFLIAPKRRLQNGQPAQFPMASNLLGGFGGFLSEKFRRHDFFLGRRNCQWFLRNHFVLPATGKSKNKLFSGWSKRMIETYKIVHDRKTYLPIIPLTGSAAEEAAEQEWPLMSGAELRELERNINKRLDGLVAKAIDSYINGTIPGGIARIVWWRMRNRAVQKLMSIIKDDLIRHGMRGEQS